MEWKIACAWNDLLGNPITRRFQQIDYEHFNFSLIDTPPLEFYDTWKHIIHLLEIGYDVNNLVRIEKDERVVVLIVISVDRLDDTDLLKLLKDTVIPYLRQKSQPFFVILTKLDTRKNLEEILSTIHHCGSLLDQPVLQFRNYVDEARNMPDLDKSIKETFSFIFSNIN